MAHRVSHGDCRIVLKTLEASSVDALVTDPPGGLVLTELDREGAGNYQLYSGQLAKSLPRLGAHKGNMVEHRRARDRFIAFLTEIFLECIRVLKPGAFGLVWAIPKTSHWTAYALEEAGFEVRDVVAHVFNGGMLRGTAKEDIPEEAEGCNTALAPAVEHWILVRKPPEGPLKANFAEHGTGVLNNGSCLTPSGGQPKNLLLSDTPPGLADVADKYPLVYVQKTPKDERFYLCTTCGVVSSKDDRTHKDHACIEHPTPKPIGLMRWLVRLVSLPGGQVLDPFAGTGTTGVAAKLENRGFVGIEEDENYVKISEHRLTPSLWEEMFDT